MLLFHYSGHGSQVDDRHGDELDDNLDEIICPYDLDWDRPFTDDDLYAIVKDLPAGANLSVILDCCHSGTGLRDLGGPARCLDRHAVSRSAAGRAVPGRLRLRAMRRFGARAAQRGAILLAACRSDQVAADASIDDDYHGAFTYYLCRALEERELRHLVRRGHAAGATTAGPERLRAGATARRSGGLLDQTVFTAPAELAVG